MPTRNSLVLISLGTPMRIARQCVTPLQAVSSSARVHYIPRMNVSCPGFRFGAVAAGIKKNGAADLALMVCDRPATAAAVFTRNRVKAAPVVVSRAQLVRSKGRARAVIVNSGNANACTGKPGTADARRMIALAAA